VGYPTIIWEHAMNQIVISAWPALLSDEAARSYLSVETAVFDNLIGKHRLQPVEVEPGLVRWRRSDLDRVVKSLPEVDPQSINIGAGGRMDTQTIAAIAAAVAARLGNKPVSESALPVRSMSILEAARALSLSRSTVYQLINKGELPVRKIGGRTVVPIEGIDALLARGSVDAGS
jgi:excisionase family DNA binding protein